MTDQTTYCQAILQGFDHLLEHHRDVFVLGQGLWSPWYVGGTMTDLDKRHGRERVIDSPVSEAACTSAAVGAALAGMRPIVVHPRMDFMILAADGIVNQAAKWAHMLGGGTHPGVTFRAIINRGGEQGAQHSQSLQSWFAHVPGLRVVMPHNPADARDMLVAATLSDDPVLYIDDRWLYDLSDSLDEVLERPIQSFRNRVIRPGSDITLAASSWGTELALRGAEILATRGISAEVVDLPVLSPFDSAALVQSVIHTGRLLAVDTCWRTCGMSSEIITRAALAVPPASWRCQPDRITLPDAPAPAAASLESAYYPTPEQVAQRAEEMCSDIPALRPDSKGSSSEHLGRRAG